MRVQRACASIFSLFVACVAVFAGCSDDTAKPKSSAKQLTSLSFVAAGNPGLSADVTAAINGTSVAATVPFGTDVTKLVATLSTTGIAVTVNGVPQLSGATANDFTSPVTYDIIAEDNSVQAYTVTVSIAPSSAKAITSFAFLSANNSGLPADVTATINGAAIAATVPFGTDVSALIATFGTTGANVSVGGTAQISGTTANNFAGPVTYTVSAADGSTQAYTVTVTVALSSAKAITSFAFLSVNNSGLPANVTATINGNAIAANVPFGTDVSALVATFTSTGASVTVGGTAQISGTTANNFTTPIDYLVTAADGTTATFTVSVTIAANPAKPITAFAFLSVNNSGLPADVTATINGDAIAATLPFGTDVSHLIATFTTTGASVTVDGVPQVSGQTANDFTDPVVYTVTAADGTTATFTVIVTIAANPAKAITAFAFLSINNDVLPADVAATINGTAIAATVPFGTDVRHLIATFTTTGANVTIADTLQTSGQTANDFTDPVVYTVPAADGTSATYTVTVSVALSPSKDITAFALLSTANPGLSADVIAEINDVTITATVPFGTDVRHLIATFATTGATVTANGVPQTSGITADDFTNPVDYTVTAADGTVKDFTVIITVAPSPAKDITAFQFLGANNPGLHTVIADINGLAISATVPFGTDVTVLVATFVTTGASVKVNGVVQASGMIANNFTRPVDYVVTAADGTTQTYTVTVTIAPAPKDITAFAFLTANNPILFAGDITGVITGTDIAVTVPFDTPATSITSLVAAFTATGTSVTVKGIPQFSGGTANDFTNPVVYTVTGADGLTKDFTVTVIIGPSPDKELTSFAFVSSANTASGLIGATNAILHGTSIEIGVAPGTDVTALAATFTLSPTAIGATVNGTKQFTAAMGSLGTPNDFTHPVVYTVTAADGTTKNFTVTVTIDLVSFSFTGAGGTDATFTSDGLSPALASAPVMSRSTVGTPTPASNAFSGSGWTTSVIDLTHYYEFTVPPAAGRTITLSELILKDQRSSMGPVAFAVRSSIDNFASDIASVLSTHPAPTMPAPLGSTEITFGPSFANQTGPITFRLYAFNAPASVGTWRVDDVQLIGTAQ